MKYFNRLFPILAGAILMAAPFFAVAVSHALEGAAMEPASNLTAGPGDSFSNDGSEYVWRPDLRAVNHHAERITLRKEGRSPAGSGETMDVKEILGKKGLFTIYQPLPASPAAGTAIRSVQQNRRPIATFPVVMNTVTKQPGIVTDDLMLNLKDLATAPAIARDYGLTLSFTSDLIRMAFYKISGETDVRSLRERLLQDVRVERVALVIVDVIQRPR